MMISYDILPQPQPDGAKYILCAPISYYSERFKKWLIVEQGFRSDGATLAVDVASASWWLHDKACKDKMWHDGSRMTARESSMILYDVLRDEGQRVRAVVWGIAIYLYQRRKPGWA